MAGPSLDHFLLRLLARLILGPLLLLPLGNLHHMVVHLVSNAFLRVFAPLDAVEHVVIDDKTAVLSGHLGVNGKDLNGVPALGTGLFQNFGLRLPLAAFHNHCHDGSSSQAFLLTVWLL